MKREMLEEYLDKKVKVTLYDGVKIEGVLYKTGDKRLELFPSFYYKKNYYFLAGDCLKTTSFLFRSSHVLKIKESI